MRVSATIKCLNMHEDNHESFYVLAISRNQVKLYECSRHAVKEVTTSNIPSNFEEVVGEKYIEKQQQQHYGAGAGDIVYHGQVGSTHFKKDNMEKFLRKINEGVCQYLKNKNAPLILATVKRIHGMYLDINSYPGLVDSFIQGSPNRMSVEKLRSKGWQILYPRSQTIH